MKSFCRTMREPLVLEFRHFPSAVGNIIFNAMSDETHTTGNSTEQKTLRCLQRCFEMVFKYQGTGFFFYCIFIARLHRIIPVTAV